MTSRERTLAAIDHQEPDRVPIFFRGVAPLNHLWKDEYERVDVLLGMGVDEKITIIDARGCYETAPMWSPQLYR